MAGRTSAIHDSAINTVQPRIWDWNAVCGIDGGTGVILCPVPEKFSSLTRAQAAMDLIQALINLLQALLQVLGAAGGLLLPWLPLIAWALFWALAVNWQKLSNVIKSGAFLGIALIGLMAVLIWGCIAPPLDGKHYFEIFQFRLGVSNFVGKLVYVVGLMVIMFAAGSCQLSGMFDGLVCFADDEQEDDHGYDDHGHGHDSHGHDSHGHDDHGHGGHDDHGHGH